MGSYATLFQQNDPFREEPNGQEVPVVLVEPSAAKTTKVWLEQMQLLDHRFRMTPVDNWIAIPVWEISDVMNGMSVGSYFCPYSRSTQTSQARRGRAKQALWTTTRACSDLSCNEIWTLIQGLDAVVCPSHMEVLGDDHSLVLSPRAFACDEPNFARFLQHCRIESSSSFFPKLWENLALVHQSPRVIRKGLVSPDSPIRESGYRLLWPSLENDNSPRKNGPGSLTWITVTEQGIRQSFDFERVMYSRGNITEKMRFGHLVQSHEKVLDMYAGIGYFTLPALIHGRAQHVVACEWNEDAAQALRFNLRDNAVEDRATVLVGDCRVLANEHGLVNKFDRVSLGLLPSCEGGWSTALRALRRETGGWLHVHSNVPVKEAMLWLEWVCVRLGERARSELIDGEPWVVIGTHLEKVKSFAPTVFHYVADVYCGPPTEEQVPGAVGYLQQGHFVPATRTVAPPSCALSSNGVLNQAWMR